MDTSSGGTGTKGESLAHAVGPTEARRVMNAVREIIALFLFRVEGPTATPVDRVPDGRTTLTIHL
jgi:hypothetical protein